MANAHFEIDVGAERQRFDMPEGAVEVVIGRASDCQWVISSGAVSRRHARIRRHGDELTIEDLGSSNGTFVNGERLSAPHALRDQDRIQLGAVEIRVDVPPPATEDATISFDSLSRASPPEPAAAEHEPGKLTPSKPRPAGGEGAPTRAPASPPPSAAVPAPKAETASAPISTAVATPASAPPPPPAPAVHEAKPQTASVRTPPPVTVPPFVKPVEPLSTRGRGGPNIAELVLIAGGSFLVVFAIGAVLIRFVF